MGQPVVHFEIAGRDAEKLEQFYTGMFEWKIGHSMPGYGMVETGGEGGINGGIMKAPHDMPYLTFYVQVDDLQAYIDKAQSLGGKALVAPTEITNMGSFAFVQDPEGNMVGLFKS